MPETQRLRLRKLTADNMGHFFTLDSDSQVMGYLNGCCDVLRSGIGRETG